MRRFVGAVIAAWLVTFAASSTVAVAAAPTLDRAYTLRDLEAAPPLDAGDGWTVRLAYGDGGDDAGPWLILYCLAERTSDAAKVPATAPARGETPDGEPLGPVVVSWGTEPDNAFRNRAMSVMPEAGGRSLYCAALRTNEAADWRLTVRGLDGGTLAQRSFDVRNVRPIRWHYFAALARQSAGKSFSTVVTGEPFPAIPRYGNSPILLPKAGKVDAEKYELPGARGEGQADALRLSLEDGVFVIRGERKMLDWPDEHLMARWWVNGKPVVASTKEMKLQQQQQRMLGYRKELRVDFGLPRILGPLKAGDKVGLQVAYLPGGIERLLKGQQMLKQFDLIRAGDKDVADLPLLSNRFDFDVTTDLLAQAAHAAAAEAGSAK